MDYIKKGTAFTTKTNPSTLPPAAEGRGVGEPFSDTDGIDSYWQSISLQAAARVARFAERPATPATGSKSELAKHLSRSRSYKLVLGFTIGAALYAGITYVFLGTLRSPLPLPNEMAGTAPLRR